MVSDACEKALVVKKAIAVTIRINDSGSAGSSCWFALSPNNTASSWAQLFKIQGLTNDVQYLQGPVMVPCDANGDVYYQCVATGAGTLDVTIEIWGYWS